MWMTASGELGAHGGRKTEAMLSMTSRLGERREGGVEACPGKNPQQQQQQQGSSNALNCTQLQEKSKNSEAELS